MPLSKQRKGEYFGKMTSLLDTYTKVFVVQVDNVGSSQMQQTRAAMRKEAEILMGKNTLMRKVLKDYLQKNPGHPYKELIPLCKGNVGFVFTNSELSQIRDKILKNRVPAPARVGAISPTDVIVPAGPTGCDPGQTAFFQTLQIATKINKGQIEILNNVPILKKGDKVGSSEATLLQKLNIKPFTYGFVISQIFDNGSVFGPEVLDITPDTLAAQFFNALSKVAALSLQIGHPTQASFPHSIANAFKTLVAVTVELENYTFERANPFKAFVKDPTAFAAASTQAAPAAAPAGGAAAPAPAAAKKEEVVEEEVDLAGGMSMFGGEGGDY
jgi:large subunit ribosomal protein LP0